MIRSSEKEAGKYKNEKDSLENMNADFLLQWFLRGKRKESQGQKMWFELRDRKRKQHSLKTWLLSVFPVIPRDVLNPLHSTKHNNGGTNLVCTPQSILICL